MRILFCNKFNYPFSGTEVYLFDLMAMLRAHGHKTALFSMADDRGGKTDFDGYLMPRVDFQALEASAWKRAQLAGRAVYSREARVRLRRFLRDFRPDVAHVRNIYHHLSPSVLWELREQGIPLVYHLNDFKLLCPSYNFVAKGAVCERCRQGQYWRVVTQGCHPSPPGSATVLMVEAYLHRWLRTYERCIDRFIAPSEFVKQKLVEAGWDAARIEVLYHFQELAGEPSKPAADGSVLYFGRLSEEKGLRDLMRAMKRVNKIRLVIAGDGPMRPELEDMAREYELGDVEFAGHLQGDVLRRRIAESAFTVFPSRVFETLGKTILESYALGRAVIATDLGSRREMVIDGETGLLYRPGDVEQLAGAISFLYQRPELAAKLGAAGRELVRTRHNPDNHYEGMMNLYNGVIEEKSRDLRQPETEAAKRVVAKPKLQVAFIGGRGVGSSYSGIEQYYEEVGKRLAAKGHLVTIYCRRYFTPKQAGPEYNGMRLVRVPTVRFKHLDTFVHTLLSTAHAMFGKHQIVHYHALGPALFSLLPRVVGKKTVVTVQGLDWQRKKWGRFASWVLRRGERASALRPNKTMVVSQSLQQYYQHRYGAPTVYIPNGTDVRRKPEPNCILKWGLQPGQYILFLGRFSPEKNLHLLVQAYEPIDTPVKLVFAGGSSYSNEYVRELRQHESQQIKVLDWLTGDPLEELLAHAMIFVLPSDLEGLSLALLDAMAAGLCVLTSDVPENRELVEGAGFTFRRGDRDDLERMLRLLIADREVREQAGRSAQQRVREHYQWDGIVDRIESEYLELQGWRANAGATEHSENEGVPVATGNKVPAD